VIFSAELIAQRKSVPGLTALVVDDNPRIRGMFAAAFLSNGFKICVEAENGKEGIEAASRIKPDVITLDYSMPVMGGLEAAPVLRQLFPRTPDNSVHSERRESVHVERFQGGREPSAPKKRTPSNTLVRCSRIDRRLILGDSGLAIARLLSMKSQCPRLR
jgi:two-component system, chemotaxis family, chemotaxis protein CheY